MNLVIVLVTEMDPKNIIRRILFFPINRIESRLKKTNWYCNSIPRIDNYPGDKWYRDHLDRNYDVVNLGSSSAVFCFNYEGLGVKAFNWALKPQSLEYSYKILKQYFSIIKQKGIVLIPFSPFSGLSVAGKWAESANDKYYHILDRTLIDDYLSVAKRREHPFLVHPKEAFKRLIKDVPRIDMYSYPLECKSTEEFQQSAMNWIKIWMKQFHITNLDVPLSTENLVGREKRLQIVKELISFCQERDLEPVIVLPPVHPTLNNYFTPRFVQYYITSFIQELSSSNVRILDYLADSDFAQDSYYRDAYFMNEGGAKAFTKKVLTDVNLLYS